MTTTLPSPPVPVWETRESLCIRRGANLAADLRRYPERQDTEPFPRIVVVEAQRSPRQLGGEEAPRLFEVRRIAGGRFAATQRRWLSPEAARRVAERGVLR